MLAACGTVEIVEKPVPAPYPVYETVRIPADLLIQHQKTAIPDDLTYGDALQLWSADRAIIDTILGQILAIKSLNDDE